ncbi:MAG: hypothetical protein J5643_11900 [Lachnospiraceae bacterium]|nr:hypothetical protein [Lachnospiraceae bacterium]
MKIIDMDAESAVKKKLGLLPVVKNIVFTDRTKDSILADVYTDKRIPVQIISFDRAFPGVIEQKLKRQGKDAELRYRIITAPYVSKLSADVCKKNGVGYVDYSGNCLISFDSIYISDIGHENLFPKKDKISRNLFKTSSHVTSSIIKVILKDLSISWKLQKLSEEVGCSIGMVAKVKEYLCNQGWAEMGKAGLRITNPAGILEAWSESYNIDKENMINAYTLLSVPEFEKAFGKTITDKSYTGCLTGFSGGARYAPVVRYTKVHIWLSQKDIAGFMEDMQIKQVDSGANISIYIAEEDDVFIDRREINGDIVASPVQAYLDLMQLKGRGEEMAEIILSKEILNDKG